MEEQKYKDDLKEIRDIMDRSSRFISLSGWSGVSAGTMALIAAYLAHRLLGGFNLYGPQLDIGLSESNMITLVGLAVITLLLALAAGIFFTTRKAKRTGHKLWDFQTRRLIVNLSIPLIAGGVLCLILLYKGYIELLAPMTLIFYGLGLIHASKFTLKEIHSLGIVQVILGLLATWFTGYGLLFWAIGFGVMHIIYGGMMQMKYEM